MLTLKIWLAQHWVVAAGFKAAALIAVAPVTQLPLLSFLVFLHSPAYMLHQLEENTRNRFKAFANERIFGGRNALSVTAILIINMPLVWGVNLFALYAACAFGAAWGLAAPYFMLVNALAHITGSLRLRVYNPGLVTSLILFLPLSIATIWEIGLSDGLAPHVIGATLSIIIHAATS